MSGGGRFQSCQSRAGGRNGERKPRSVCWEKDVMLMKMMGKNEKVIKESYNIENLFKN